MFDLHMHTKFSDGIYNPDELVERLKNEGVTLFSITDHNHSLAYEKYDNFDLNYIKGTEIATSYEGVIIEILGYKVDHKVINEWYRDFYSADNLAKIENLLFNDLKEMSKENGYQVDQNLEMEKIEKGLSKKTIYYHLFEKYDDFEFKTYKEFFRRGLSNPESPWFLDEGRTYPSIKEVIDLIHKAGGIAFLAHPYEYGFDSFDKLFETLIDLGIDGIECFHPSCAMINSVKLAKYCVENKLLGSGGSDFHSDKRLVPLGVHINKNLFEFECFDWIRELL